MTKLMQAAEIEEMKLARVLMMLSELPYKMADITMRYKMTENTAASTNANWRNSYTNHEWKSIVSDSHIMVWLNDLFTSKIRNIDKGCM